MSPLRNVAEWLYICLPTSRRYRNCIVLYYYYRNCGTEKVTIAAIQTVVLGDAAAHRYGTSTGNQHIEAWWSFYRRNRSQFWIELFKHLVHTGVFNPENPREVDCIRYCFMSVVQSDLDAIRRHWNTHRIRPSVGSRCPAMHLFAVDSNELRLDGCNHHIVSPAVCTHMARLTAELFYAVHKVWCNKLRIVIAVRCPEPYDFTGVPVNASAQHNEHKV